jgi:WD40 repeat protein
VLDFFDAWKKRRPGTAAKKPASRARAGAPAPAPEPPAGSGAAAAARTSDEAVSVPRPVPAVLVRRAPPRPRRVRGWRVPSRRWRSLLYKLLIGLGVAGLAVAYEDKLPRMEGRGAGVVTSQATDLSPVVRIAGHRGAVVAVATADQGRWIVSAGTDGTLKVWNAASGMLVRAIELDDGPATAIAVDDRRALTGHKGGAIVLWDLERAERLALFRHQQAPISALAFTGDGDHFAAASQTNAVALFDVRAPAQPAAVFQGQDGGRVIASARRSELLATAAGQDAGIRLWRTDTHSLARHWRVHSELPSALEMAPGGRRIASGSTTGAVRVWSTSSSRPQRSFKAHEGRVTSLAFAPNDRLLASAGEDGQVKLWDLRSGRPPRVLNHAGGVRSVAFSADGRNLLSAGQDGVIRVWNGVAPAARE